MSSTTEKTRVRILESTVGLLERSDGRVVSMSKIAKEAGITRQALYLHFSNRADLLVEATHFLDVKLGSSDRLAASRQANSGVERLDAYIEAWCNYIPEVYGVARALMAMAASDEDAKQAWQLRMQDMWEGCEAAIKALKEDNCLTPGYTVNQASDLLWTLLSIRNWELLHLERGWNQQAYVESVKVSAHRIFVQ